jgi:type IV fimbrial biogenesis protein FimT
MMFMREHGFTLLELLITLTILVILLTVGLPSFSQQIQNSKTRTFTLELMQAVQQTRTLAVSKNQRATLRNFGRWENGWELFLDKNNNGLRDDDEVLVFQKNQRLTSVITAPGDPVSEYVSFIGTGVGRRINGALQMATINICSTDSGAAYALVLSTGGRMRMEETQTSQCDV